MSTAWRLDNHFNVLADIAVYHPNLTEDDRQILAMTYIGKYTDEAIAQFRVSTVPDVISARADVLSKMLPNFKKGGGEESEHGEESAQLWQPSPFKEGDADVFDELNAPHDWLPEELVDLAAHRHDELVARLDRLTSLIELQPQTGEDDRERSWREWEDAVTDRHNELARRLDVLTQAISESLSSSPGRSRPGGPAVEKLDLQMRGLRDRVATSEVKLEQRLEQAVCDLTIEIRQLHAGRRRPVSRGAGSEGLRRPGSPGVVGHSRAQPAIPGISVCTSPSYLFPIEGAYLRGSARLLSALPPSSSRRSIRWCARRRHDSPPTSVLSPSLL